MAFTLQDTIILSVENLSVKYGDKTIIENINMEERDVVRTGHVQGQSIAILGRSGRGKSTLFRSLCGLEKPSTGFVRIPDFKNKKEDEPYQFKEVHEGDMGFVNQHYTLFRHKTVEQAMLFAMRKQDGTKQEKLAHIHDLLKKWGLYAVRHQYPNELSGGQRQRTAILEQVVGASKYYILDEPFSGLDVGNIERMKETFRLINAEDELNTIIFSTHDIELAIELADSVYVVGYLALPDGSYSEAATIIKHFDLKSGGVAWQDKLSQAHLDIVEEVKQAMMGS
ncbi:MAG TPA: ATP-binding cassette domain-containing protein [Saprospiraceae bacterium]|nr:ATP-binding cassette domain-containing protein [Saprospiraceae bacterium]HMQ84216.1 ATP-binding cassette domain-containing protein [Saprospiraceae bacterium]